MAYKSPSGCALFPDQAYLKIVEKLIGSFVFDSSSLDNEPQVKQAAQADQTGMVVYGIKQYGLTQNLNIKQQLMAGVRCVLVLIKFVISTFYASDNE